MSYRLLGPLWRRLPPSARLFIIRRTQPTFTVSAAAIVLNERNEVLLLDHVLRPASGWGLPGGFLDAGEQPQDAVRRELKEETGIEVDELRLISMRTFKRHIEILFAARSNDKASILSGEITDLGWYSFENMPAGVPRNQKLFIESVLKGEV